MRILVTGGCGFLGAHIVEHLLRNSDAEIIVLDRLTYASAGYDRLRDIAAFDDRRVRVLGADLREPLTPGVERELGRIDYIIHAAAETHVDNSIVNPLPFLESNVIGTHHLLMLAKSKQPTRVFVVSTDEVYGPAEPGFAGFLPGDRYNPTNPYAAAKAGAEAVCAAYANTYKIPITIVNGMNFFGERQHPEKFIPGTIRKVRDGELVTIHADATRTISGSRFYLHCRNFADALLHMINNPTPPPKVHIVGEKEISNLDMALLIASFVGKPLRYEMVDFHSSRPGHDLRYAMRDSYIAESGWVRPLSIEESMERNVRWYMDPKNARWLNWDAE